MTCHQARQQLAAYRRDDWTASELRLLADHLTTCAECRQVEATYRRVGESIRLLPSITPDASFRASVFAAIAAEDRKLGPAAMRVSRAETEPSLPVVRAPITPMPIRKAQRPVARAAMAIAAVLALALFATQFIPSLDTDGFAVNLFRGASSAALSSRVTHYQPNAQLRTVTGVRATSDWVAYTGTDAAGATMLFVTNRQTNQTRTILSATTGAVHIYSVTADWLVWSDASNGWTLRATALTGSSAWRTVQLAQADAVSSLLTGVAVTDSSVLVGTASQHGNGLLWSIPLTGGAGVVVAQASHMGGVIMNPASANGATYWNEIWADVSGTLHGAMWRSTAAGSAAIAPAGDEAYGLAVAQGRLVWVSASQTPTLQATDAATLAQAASETTGSVESMSIGDRAVHMVDTLGVAGSLQAAGSLAVWSDGAAPHVWNLGQNASDAATSLLGKPAVDAVSADALAWFDGSRIGVYTD